MCALYNRDRARDGREDDDKRRHLENNARRLVVTREETMSNLVAACADGLATLIARIIVPRNDNDVANDRRCLRTMETAPYKHIASFSLQH